MLVAQYNTQVWTGRIYAQRLESIQDLPNAAACERCLSGQGKLAGCKRGWACLSHCAGGCCGGIFLVVADWAVMENGCLVRHVFDMLCNSYGEGIRCNAGT